MYFTAYDFVRNRDAVHLALSVRVLSGRTQDHTTVTRESWASNCNDTLLIPAEGLHFFKGCLYFIMLVNTVTLAFD